MSLPQFKLLRPRTLEEAIGYLAKHGGLPVQAADAASSAIRIVAGGTDLIPSMRQKLFEPQYVLDIRHIAELKGIRERQGSGVEIGALTSLTTIEHSDLLRRRYPVLTEAAATVASPLAAQHGHDWRKHLSRHPLPLVQPVAHLAKRLRLLHQERRRLVPCGAWRNKVLGRILWGHPPGAVVSEC